jgi:hypothetical protein
MKKATHWVAAFLEFCLGLLSLLLVGFWVWGSDHPISLQRSPDHGDHPIFQLSILAISAILAIAFRAHF